MNRSDLIQKLSEKYPKLGQKCIDAIVRMIFSAMCSNIADANRVEIRGFGCFSLKQRNPGIIRNPRMGTSMYRESRSVVYFRAGKELKARVNVL